MKIAVAFQNGQVLQHFEHGEQFKIYDAEIGRILSSQVISAAGGGHGPLVGFLRQQGVQLLICGGIGDNARIALAAAEIQLYPGVAGGADDVVEALLHGTLEYVPDSLCSRYETD